MNIKKVKSFSASLLVFAMAFNVFTPTIVGAADVGAKNVETTMTRAETGVGNSPIVKAKWEMNVVKDTNGKYLGTDDATTAGAQFIPSGKYQVNKRIAVCAVVTDPDGDDINKVYADTFYPQNIFLGPNHTADRQGCGDLMSEFTLTKLNTADSMDLFCNKVRTGNSNLPVFNTKPIQYTYDEICASTGEIPKLKAYVYCGERDISYEDPSGDYRTLVLAQDKAGLDGTLENFFKYLPVTAFETDFSKVDYGTMKLITEQIIAGDLTWDVMNQGKATVRNIGNTRLTMKVMQDDMGLGQTDGKWNVKYDARVGSDATDVDYLPNVTKALNNPLNLSETDEMDFSIYISKFPPEHSASFIGNMTLSAVSTAHLTCDTGGDDDGDNDDID